MRRLFLFAALIGLLLFGACSDDTPSVDAGDDTAGDGGDAAAEPEVQTIDFSAKEYAYSSIKGVKSGLVEFNMKNDGKELHIAAISKIDDGKTFADATKDLQSATPPADPASEEYGGIASTNPGLNSKVTLAMEEGSYFFACYVPAADGTPHVAKGMILPFEVTGEVAEPDLGAADAEVTAKDFSYTTTATLKAGEQVVELDNEGTQGHEITLLEFDAGKGPGDLAAYFEKPEGPPPATFYGGPFVAKGRTARWVTPKLEAGKSYFFMCLIPDPADGVPHAAKGMVLPVRVT
jgi:hypothetical protein